MKYFYQCLALIYLFSFVSIYIQYPGVYGWNGLLPVDLFVTRVRPEGSTLSDAASLYVTKFPSVLLFSQEMGVSVECFAEFLLLIGIVTSVISALGYYHVISFAILYIIYISVLLSGQAFMSFQWDILLVEVGFLAMLSLFYPFTQYAGKTVMKLLFRFIAWKLMFMAGVVKVFSNCPTWLQFTALEYHFATQPLPHGMSWYAHQLHPLILRAGVAVTLLIEIPLSYFCIGHFAHVRKVGAIAHGLLMLTIIATGNYNFFNLLTLLLMIPVWDADIETESKANYSVPNRMEMNQKHSKEVTSKAWFYDVMKYAFIVNAIALLGAMMFELKILSHDVRVPDTFTAVGFLNSVQLNLTSQFRNILPKAVRYSGVVAAGMFDIYVKCLYPYKVH